MYDSANAIFYPNNDLQFILSFDLLIHHGFIKIKLIGIILIISIAKPVKKSYGTVPYHCLLCFG